MRGEGKGGVESVDRGGGGKGEVEAGVGVELKRVIYVRG